MSDYDPKLDPGRDATDPYRNSPDSGRSGYVLLAALAGVALVGGYLYFGNPQNAAPEQAQVPSTTERALTDTPAGQNPDRPAAIPMPAAPAPATPAAPRAAPQE